MGRPPSNGGPAFRFTHNEVAEMEAILHENKLQVPSKDLIGVLSEKFSESTERAGKVLVQTKQVWNWFQNRRYALRSKFAKPPVKLTVTQLPREDVGPARNVPQGLQYQPAQSGRNAPENPQMEFEAKSARDGAWYDVQAFVSHRYLDTGKPEVLVRFAGFGLNEEEWVNVRKHVRQRSLPCESSECVALLPGDLILCFQEGKDQALYFDAHILDAQRRRHDIRGCRCRFLVCYSHDQTEEIVPLRKVCRRPETDYRLQQLSPNEPASVTQKVAADPTTGAISKPAIPSEAVQLNHKPAPIPSNSVVPAPVQENASAPPPGTAPSEPMEVDTAAPVYILFAGSAPDEASTPPSETAKQ